MSVTIRRNRPRFKQRAATDFVTVALSTIAMTFVVLLVLIIALAFNAFNVR